MALEKLPQPKKELDPRMKDIGDKIKRLRIEAGYTNYEHFAWDHNIGRMQVWRMETGSNFNFSSFFKILDAHGISPADFFAEFTEAKEKK
jgi:hypothetical protein